MTIFQTICILLVAVLHGYFLILEMFFWTSKKGIKTFGLKSKQYAEDTKVLAANQGLYNGFLSAGLLWSIYTNKNDIAIFFLSCVIIAGIYGAYSTKKIKIFFIQSIPAFIGVLSFLFF